MHMEELSGRTDVTTLGCSERLKVHWLERTTHRKARRLNSTLFHFIIPFYFCLCQPQPSLDARGRSWHWGPGREMLRGCHEPPPTVTNVPLWPHGLETEGQTAGRKQGRKEGALEDKVDLWTAIMDI